MPKYALEFILQVDNVLAKTLKESLAGLGDSLEVIDGQQNFPKGKSFKIYISTQDPALIFDTCAQFGRIKSVKVDEA